MSFHVSPRKLTPVVAVGSAYWGIEATSRPTPILRPMTALEQMYAYWGSDSE